MRRRSLLAMGAAGGTAAVLGAGTSALAAQSDSSPSSSQDSHADIDPTSLRALGSQIGMHIGSAIIPQDINTPAWAAIAAAQFNVYTPGNEMKWQVVEPTQGTFDWSGADNLVNFAETNRARVRGHTLLWHNQLPNWLTTGVGNGSITTSQLWSLLEEHIFTEVGRYKGRIWQWDVANEFFTDSNPSGLNPNDFWIKALGPTVLPQAFKWAHEADKHALLFYNDYNIAGEDGSNAKSDAVFAWVQQMLDQGVPVMGIGNQGHLDTQFGFSGQRFQADLERYASLGLFVAITEADVRTFVDGPTTQVPTSNLALFAQPFEFGQMIKAAIAVPEVLSFTVWGFTDADSWVPGFFTGEGYATIYDVNQNPKPAYFELQQDLMQAAGVMQHQRTRNG
jgi:endo-1,4-beta-xylanase